MSWREYNNMLEFTFASERAELGLFGTSRGGFAAVCTRKYENIHIDSNSSLKNSSSQSSDD
jgi:hypothetical protein